MEYLAMLAKLVAWADEVRANIKAQGEEAERMFEEAVTRNRESYTSMIAGGVAPADKQE